MHDAAAIRQGRIKLLGLAIFFALPVFGAYLAFFLDWAPRTTSNYGEFITPRLLPDVTFDAGEGQRVAMSELRGRWMMVQVDSSACDAWCEKKLYYMRQIRTAQGKDAPRVERVWLVTDAQRPDPGRLVGYDGTRVLNMPPGPFAQAFIDASAEPARHDAPSDHLFVIDPMGNLVLRYPRDANASRIIKDLEKLLKYTPTR
jgi:cytochrome oxidase Cu insertion factor (SCO1/SenC/PrrC family)